MSLWGLFFMYRNATSAWKIIVGNFFLGGGGQKWPKKTVLGSLKEIAYFYIVFLFFWKTKKVAQFFMLLGVKINSFVILSHCVTKINYVIEYSNEVHYLFTLFFTRAQQVFVSDPNGTSANLCLFVCSFFFFCNTLNRRHWSKFHIWFRLSIEYWSTWGHCDCHLAH